MPGLFTAPACVGCRGPRVKGPALLGCRGLMAAVASFYPGAPRPPRACPEALGLWRGLARG